MRPSIDAWGTPALIEVQLDLSFPQVGMGYVR